jgi:hypothetical protein
MRIRTAILLVLLLGAVSARANTIQLGSVTFTGEFTLNHNYDFNHPADHPFGWFGPMTAQDVTGVFLKWAHNGEALGFSNGNALNTVNSLPVWTLGKVLLSTLSVSITGPDAGRFVFGALSIMAPGYTPPPNATA